MKPATERVVAALKALGVDAAIVEFSESTHTAAEAAQAVGADVGQIVKSLVFIAGEKAILTLVSGADLVDTARLADITGAPITRASAEIVREATGYSIGGVPPVGHATALPTYCDAALQHYRLVWAAAGTPNAVFAIAPADLIRISGARVVDLAKR